ncbi:hypothetical protein JX265_012740 [Neoarthrinium moseri]|uniref:Uncharacterized protein n=1 Tax=Neoarthrinium moseri TaxID=1658444 RepID=A0A9P9W9P8_9PEZI|nr:hypothetical protein JX265_012740 [Neoarthrinium moseri]
MGLLCDTPAARVLGGHLPRPFGVTNPGVSRTPVGGVKGSVPFVADIINSIQPILWPYTPGDKTCGWSQPESLPDNDGLGAGDVALNGSSHIWGKDAMQWYHRAVEDGRLHRPDDFDTVQIVDVSM